MKRTLKIIREMAVDQDSTKALERFLWISLLAVGALVALSMYWPSIFNGSISTATR